MLRKDKIKDGKRMKYYTQFVIIMGFSLAGEALQRLIPANIPASVYGLALLFLALCLKIVKVEQVKTAAGFLISIMPVLFVSPTVSIMEDWVLMKGNLISIFLLLFLSTILSFAVGGSVTQWVMKKGGKHHD